VNINGAFPSNFIKAADLQGSEPIVTIKSVEFEPVGQEKEMKPVVYFVNKEKGMVLNKTNANTIATLTGTFETEDWPDSRIRLYATTTAFQGKTVDTIRIKAAPPAGAKPAPVVIENADEIPF